MKPTPLPPNPKLIDRMFLLVLPLLCVSCATKSDPFQTFYTPTVYSNLATTGSKVTPTVYFYEPATAEEQRREDVAIIQQGYVPIGTSNFQSIWRNRQPHREAAAEMGRKVGADLVVYQMAYLGTRLMGVPHVSYEPGQSFTTTTSLYVGNTYGSFTS